MKILEKLAAKNAALWEHPTVSIAFFGDSVTQGCFEIFRKDDGQIETVFDQHSGYPHQLAKLLAQLYPAAPVQIINAGLSGDNVPHACKRLERDVLRYSPDLTVVCFGLNDCMVGMEFLPRYLQGLEEIFRRLQAAGSEVIFMTPNMMNTHVSCHLKEDWVRRYAATTAQAQNSGTMDAFMEGAREVAKKCGVVLCDCYRIWKQYAQNGVVIADLLENKTNHPTRQLHHLFATELLKSMFDN